MKKVIVSGYFNETFEGSDKEILRYLSDLKDRQENLLSEQDNKHYQYITKKEKTCHINNAHEHHDIKKIFLNDFDRLKFRAKNKELGLKIQIL